MLADNRLLVLNLDDQLHNHQAFAFQQNSELLDLFNYHINKLEASGVLQHIKNDWIYSGAMSDQSDKQPEAVVLGFENVFFPFVVVGSGMLGSIIISVLEKFISYDMLFFSYL